MSSDSTPKPKPPKTPKRPPTLEPSLQTGTYIDEDELYYYLHDEKFDELPEENRKVSGEYTGEYMSFKIVKCYSGKYWSKTTTHNY